MAEAVYFLCALASIGCAVLLLRAYARRRTRLLLWCALCFVGLALNNVLLFADLVLVPDVDLSLFRQVSAFGSVVVLLYGLVWDAR
jgi:hydrogenase/urease accessory protein HupE